MHPSSRIKRADIRTCSERTDDSDLVRLRRLLPEKPPEQLNGISGVAALDEAGDEGVPRSDVAPVSEGSSVEELVGGVGVAEGGVQGEEGGEDVGVGGEAELEDESVEGEAGGDGGEAGGGFEEEREGVGIEGGEVGEDGEGVGEVVEGDGGDDLDGVLVVVLLGFDDVGMELVEVVDFNGGGGMEEGEGVQHF